MSFIHKLEHYCVYQDRCHKEVIQKMYDLQVPHDQRDEIIVRLINDNFLNEERFARSFARGKHAIKKWGRVRITNELKLREISAYLIKKALSEISEENYEQTFYDLASKQWEMSTETHLLKKKKKVSDFLFRKGYEKEKIYDFISGY